jgi:hypothetical protein
MPPTVPPTERTLSAVVLAEPGAGSTTFLGLMYAAMVRLGTERTDRFRFTSPPESMTRLARLYAQLMTGELPETPTDADVTELRVELAFRRPPSPWDRLRGDHGFDPADRVGCRWVRMGFESLGGTLRGQGPGTAMSAGITTCRVPIIVLPATSSSPSAVPPEARDIQLRAVLEALAPSLPSGRRPATGGLHPIVVFTRVDGLPTDELRRFGLDSSLDETTLRNARGPLGQALMERLIPLTHALCVSPNRGMEVPEVFFSYLRVERDNADGSARLAMRTTADHHREPIYPVGEYRGVIERLGVLARSAP